MTASKDAKKGNGGEGVNVAFVAGTLKKHWGTRDIPDGNGGTVKVARLLVDGPNGNGGHVPIYVEVFGNAAAAAAAKLAEGKRVQMAGEVRRSDWDVDAPAGESAEGEEGKRQNTRLVLHVEEGEADHEIAAAESTDDVNQVHLAGEINWVGDLEEIRWKSSKDGEQKSKPKRRLFVSVPKTTPSGKAIRPSFPIEVLGAGAGEAFAIGKRIEIHGAIDNRIVPGKPAAGGEAAAKNRYFASVVVSGEGHGIQLAS